MRNAHFHFMAEAFSNGLFKNLDFPPVTRWCCHLVGKGANCLCSFPYAPLGALLESFTSHMVEIYRRGQI